MEIPETLNFEGHITNPCIEKAEFHVFVDLAMEFDMLPHFQSMVSDDVCVHLFE